MLGGEVFKRSISAGGAQYFLQRILESRGSNAANNALVAVWKHIAYYESLEQGHLNKLRAVANDFIAALPEGISLEVSDAQFSAAVARSRTDSPEARDKRLKKANPTPQTQVVTTRVFKRNADVVAAVLARAQGTCERCEKPAPFARSTDGSPYLEVHHRTQLAHGGQDSVANAIALCPNCHRQLHHG
ncbi:MAG: HNH endonuclease [Burkholderiales bacterium]|nr:HNH endonuclease [Burkholderiales bacterium]MDE2396567.1 HNH endonuclease [Burkholderiales bacterium]MDE2457579.1 HNH endonuclease [Burkholderiales bacterium]